jgi:hypothetical protein
MKAPIAVCMVLISCTVHAQSINPFVFDKTESSRMGAIDLVSLDEIVNQYEQQYLPQKLGDEDTRLSNLGGRLYRLGKTILFENVQDFMIDVVQHEVFGHGARLREFGSKDLEYHLEAVPPYGHAHGWTSWKTAPILSADEDVTMRIAGMESELVMAAEIRNRVLERNQLNYREANLYFVGRLANTIYAYSTHPSDISAYNGNDIANYVRVVSIRNPNVTLSRIQTLTLLNVLDPLTIEWFYSAHKYIAKGEIMSALPTVQIGKENVLFGLHFSLTPFGYEYTLESFLRDSNRIAEVTGSVGSADEGMSAALKVGTDRLWSRGAIKIGGHLNVWQQPMLFLLKDDFFNPDTQTIGGLIAMTASCKFAEHAGLIVEVGYKSRGYVAGEALDSGPIIRGGISIMN